MNLKEFQKLENLRPCSEVLEYAKKFDTLQQAWDDCERSDWMLWLLSKICGQPRSQSRHELVWIACQCARLSLQYVPKNELRPLQAIEAAEGWSAKIPGFTLKKIKKNADIAANAAADANSADAYDAANAAYAAAAAADAAYIVNPAYIANAAIYVADAAFYAYDADKKILKKCADIIKIYHPIIKL